jgi:phosphoglycolate phosphatase
MGHPPCALRKLLLFDIDGTLLASGGAGMRALVEAAAEVFGSRDLDGIDIAGRTDTSIARQLYERAGQPATAENIAGLNACYLRHLEALLPDTKGSVLPGVFAILDRLAADRRYILALLTGNLEAGARMKLTRFGLWHYFGFGAYADDHHDRNALGPVAFARARASCGVDIPAHDSFIIGDTPHDVACARACGARAVAVATGRHSPEELARCEPDWLFESLADVPAVLAAFDGAS